MLTENDFIDLGLMNKKGVMYEVGVQQFNRITQATVGLKVKIF